MAPDRIPIQQNREAQDRRCDRDTRKEQPEGELGGLQAVTSAPDPGRRRHSDSEICRRDHEQWQCIEENSLGFRAHWALRMIGAGPWRVETARRARGRKAVFVPFQKMGQTAYWQVPIGALASLPLGDAHRWAVPGH